MWFVLILILLGVVAFGFVAGYFNDLNIRRKLKKGEIKEAPPVNPIDMECCGQHEVCEKESLLAALSKKIEYYDDEELDRFRGRGSDEYTEEEEEEFRDILYTTKEDEVAGWRRSLQLRGIQLPDGLKDELFLIIGERRTSK